MNRITTVLCGATAALLACGYAGAARADAALGTLYFTTYDGNVWSTNYNYNGGSLPTSFTLSAPHHIASPTGADGLLFAPNGNLLVAGQGNSVVNEVTTGGSVLGTDAAGTGSYHLALASNAPNAILYNMWNGGGSGGSTSISAITLSGGGIVGAAAGVAYSVSCSTGHTGCSTDVRGVIFDPRNSTWYYGTAPDGGTGDLGQVVFNDSLHTATLTPILPGVAAHGLSFDPFTNDIIANAGATVNQFDPTSNTIVSSLTESGSSFDQAAEDGKGHLFVASNDGHMLFADYKSTGFIGTSSFTVEPFLASQLDDVAPLSGTGSNTHAPEPMSIALLGAGLAGLGMLRRRAPRRADRG